jgi:hypothetical protein
MGSGLLQMITVKHYVEHFRLSQAILKKKKVFCSCAHDSWAPEVNPTNMIFLGMFVVQK